MLVRAFHPSGPDDNCMKDYLFDSLSYFIDIMLTNVYDCYSAMGRCLTSFDRFMGNKNAVRLFTYCELRTVNGKNNGHILKQCSCWLKAVNASQTDRSLCCKYSYFLHDEPT